MNRNLIRSTLLILSAIMIPSVTWSQTTSGWSASKETEERLSKSRSEFNYYEDRVKPYSLPDILISPSGKKIGYSRDWQKYGRPELLELFRSDMFGKVPVTPYKKSFRVVKEDKNALGGAATFKQIDVSITAGEKTLVINLYLFVPNKSIKPVPAFLLINLGSKGIDPTRQTKSESWPVEDIISRGYAAAAFSNADVDPDNFDDFKNGIHALLDKTPRTGDSWGTLAAWAWGASRCMDYLVTDKNIAAKKVAVVGHSRGGKTALWAGAEDERFSIVIANESGAGGAAIARRRLGETVKRLNSSFPHWYCTNYRKFDENENSMPFDMHMLLALTAPRALYIDAAAEDLWGDPKGCYLSLYNSLPVFRLYDRNVNIPEQMPPLNKQIISGNVGFHIRDGEHALKLSDWNMFMDFAGKVWK